MLSQIPVDFNKMKKGELNNGMHIVQRKRAEVVVPRSTVPPDSAVL